MPFADRQRSPTFFAAGWGMSSNLRQELTVVLREGKSESSYQILPSELIYADEQGRLWHLFESSFRGGS